MGAMKCVVTALFLAVFGVTKSGALFQVADDSDGVVFSGKGAITDKAILSSGELELAASSSALLERPRRKPSPKKKPRKPKRGRKPQKKTKPKSTKNKGKKQKKDKCYQWWRYPKDCKKPKKKGKR